MRSVILCRAITRQVHLIPRRLQTATAIALGVGTGFALTGILQPGGGLF